MRLNRKFPFMIYQKKKPSAFQTERYILYMCKRRRNRREMVYVARSYTQATVRQAAHNYDINDTSATRHMMYRSINPWWQWWQDDNGQWQQKRTKFYAHLFGMKPIEWISAVLVSLSNAMHAGKMWKILLFFSPVRITTLCLWDEIAKWAHVQGYDEGARIRIWIITHIEVSVFYWILQINEYITDNNSIWLSLWSFHSFDVSFRKLIQPNRFGDGQILSE